MVENNNKKEFSIVIPAHNEELEIANVLNSIINDDRLKGLVFEIIVVDDASSDKTAEVASKYNIRLIRHERNRGYGASLKTGIRHARYDIIVIIDADSSYPANKIAELVSLVGEYDMVVAARVNNYAKMHLVRYLPKWFLNKYANFLVQEKIPDINSGLRAFKKDIYEKYKSMLPNGFSFTTTITLAFLSNDYLVKYIPIDYHKRGGQSKIKPIHDTINFFLLISRVSLYFYPLRIFMPVAFSLLFVGTILFIYNVFVSNITDITVMIFLWGMQIGAIGLLADMINQKR